MKTIKVRIAVAVDKDGKYVASAYNSNDSWDECMSCALDLLEPGEARYWVTAELPLPETGTIEGKIESEP